jgi:hypothetical protein
MNNYVNFSATYEDSCAEVLEQLNHIYSDELKAQFLGLEVELKRPPKRIDDETRHVSGIIVDINLWMSRPRLEVPLLMCTFEVKGQDQFGDLFHELVKESDLITKLPWKKIAQPTKHELDISFT